MDNVQFGAVHGLIAIDSHLQWARILKRLEIECGAPATWWRMPSNPNMKLIRIAGDSQRIGWAMKWATYLVDGHTVIASHGIWFRAGRKTVWAKDEPIAIDWG